MKRLISLLLVLCMVCAAVPMAVMTSGATTYGYLLGDANDDNVVTLKDILAVRRYVAGVIGEKDLNCKASDTDKNELVTLNDVLILRRFVAGVSSLEGVNEDGRFKVGTFAIGGKNITRYTIVLPDDSTACMDNAAKVLRNKLADACGYTLSISNNEELVTGYKIKFEFDRNDEYELGLEGYRVYVDDNGDLRVVCGSMRGPIYAAYFMLEKLVGYRFLTGNETYLYKAESIDVPAEFDTTEIPGYSYRALSQIGGSGENAIPLRLNDSRDAQNAKAGWRVGTLFIHAHSYAYQIAGYDHIYDEAYASQFHNTQPCLTDEETYEKIVDYNLKLLAEREGKGQHLGETYTQISCSPNDNTDFCDCTKCKAIYEIEGSIAGTVFRLSNRVIETLQETYPTIELYTIAYWDARNPPVFTRPHDDICVCFCIGGCNNHTYDDVASCAENGGNPRLYSPSGECSSNVEDMDFCAKWAELTNNLQIWYYSANFCYYMAPAPNVTNVYNDFKFLADLGATGMYSEGSGTGYTFEKLRGYLAAKMMWNPSMSEEEFNDLLNEYLMIYFGPGWTYIREYLDMQTEAGDLQGCWTNNYDRPWDMYNEEYFKENYLYMTGLFDKALAAAETANQRTHLNECRLHCDFLGLSATYERDWVNGDEDTKAAYAARYKALYDYVVNNGIRCAGFDCQNFPKNATDIYKPMQWYFDDFNGHWNWNGTRWV